MSQTTAARFDPIKMDEIKELIVCSQTINGRDLEWQSANNANSCEQRTVDLHKSSYIVLCTYASDPGGVSGLQNVAHRQYFAPHVEFSHSSTISRLSSRDRINATQVCVHAIPSVYDAV